jgi:uncharacterized membrane protein required for colicin V production
MDRLITLNVYILGYIIARLRLPFIARILKNIFSRLIYLLIDRILRHTMARLIIFNSSYNGMYNGQLDTPINNEPHNG